MARALSETILSAATSTGAGSAVDVLDFNRFSFFINASSVTTGGTVVIQGLSPAGDWVAISTTAITADGDTLVEEIGSWLQVRANVTARTDGTYTVSMVAGESASIEEATAESVVSTSSLVSFWKLDEASGTRYDAWGSNDLTDNNTVGQGAGTVYANCADFESTNSEYLTHADNADLSGGSKSFTISFWFKCESIDYAGQQFLLSKIHNWGGAQIDYGILFASDTTFRFIGGIGTSASNYFYISSSTLPSTSTWYHCAARYDHGGGQAELFLDGVSVGSESHSAGTYNGTDDFTIGAYNESVIQQYHDGLIEAFGFWNRALSDAEITALANASDPFYDQF